MNKRLTPEELQRIIRETNSAINWNIKSDPTWANVIIRLLEHIAVLEAELERTTEIAEDLTLKEQQPGRIAELIERADQLIKIFTPSPITDRPE